MKLKIALLCMVLIAFCIILTDGSDDRTLNAFIQTLGGNDSHARMEAAVSLGDLKDARAVEPLIKALNDSDKYVRIEAARALENIGDRRAVDPLIRVLKQNPAAEYNFVESLAWFADPKSIDVLSQVCDEINKKPHKDNMDYITYDLAAWGIARTKDPRSIDPLIRILQDDIAGLGAKAATSGLVSIGKPAVDPLIHALNNNEFESRDSAAAILGEIGDPRAVDPLIQILKNTGEDSTLRINAALALGAIGDDRAIDPLIQASKDSNKDIRYEASDALVMINNHVKPKLTPMPDESELLIQ